MQRTACDYAALYARRGWHVFPIMPNSKYPFKDFKWRELSTADLPTVQRYADQYPNCNWAIDCGKSNVFIVDIDLKADIESTLDKMPEPLPATYTVQSPSGGEHYYYAGRGKNSAGSIFGPGFDTRGVGGYALIPGSSIGGKPYVCVADTAPAPMPAWIARRAVVSEKPATPPEPMCSPDTEPNLLTAVKYLLHEAPEAGDGERDDTCLQVAKRLGDFGVSEKTAAELMSEIYADKVAFDGNFTERDMLKKVARAYMPGSRHSAFGCDTPEAMFPALPGQENDAYRCATDIVRANIKPRQWLLYGRYAKSFVTVTASPGGVGKSSLALLECFALSTGIQYTYHQVRETGASWYYNTEDDYDELERRIEAIKIHHNVRNADFKHRFYFSSGRTKPLKLVTDDKKLGLVINEAGIQWLIDTITEQQTKLFILDPFVRAHSVSEQGIDLDVVVQQLQRVADATGCAISILHHTTKGKANGYGDADKVRGSGSLVASARIVHMLAPMEDKDARQYGLNAGDNQWYCRMDIAKGNLTAPGRDIMWFKKVSVQVIDGDRDTIGAIERASLCRVVPTDPVEMIKDLVSKSMNPGEEKSFYNLAVAIASMELTGLKRNSLEVRLKDIYASPVFYEGRDFRPTMVRGGRGKETAGLRCDEAP